MGNRLGALISFEALSPSFPWKDDWKRLRRRRRLRPSTTSGGGNTHTVHEEAEPMEEMDLSTFLLHDPHAYQLMEGQTALHLVALAGRVDLLQYMLTAHKVDVNKCNHEGRTALAEVVVAGTSTEVLDVLWRHEADPTTRETLHYICQRGCDPETFALVLEHVDDVELGDETRRWSPLHVAACHGQLELVKVLLRKGSDISAQSQEGFTPIDLACAHNQVDVVRWLLQHYWSPVDDHQQETSALLTTACRTDSLQVTKLLIEEFMVDPYSQSIDGKSALEWALEGSGLDTLYYLLRLHNAIAYLP